MELQIHSHPLLFSIFLFLFVYVFYIKFFYKIRTKEEIEIENENSLFEDRKNEKEFTSGNIVHSASSQLNFLKIIIYIFLASLLAYPLASLAIVSPLLFGICLMCIFIFILRLNKVI